MSNSVGYVRTRQEDDKDALKYEIGDLEYRKNILNDFVTARERRMKELDIKLEQKQQAIQALDHLINDKLARVMAVGERLAYATAVQAELDDKYKYRAATLEVMAKRIEDLAPYPGPSKV